MPGVVSKSNPGTGFALTIILHDSNMCTCILCDEYVDYVSLLAYPNTIIYSTDQRKGKRFPRAICGRSASCPRSSSFLTADTMQAIRRMCARGSTHAGDGNQFMGVVELPKGAIIELDFSIDK